MHDDIEFDTDDELLSAWLDGELPAERRAALEARLATDKALARRLERLRRANSAVRDSYTRVADEPLPQGVLDLVADDLAARRRMQPRFAAPWQLALAASVTLAIGGTLGYLMAPRDPATAAGLLASTGAVAPGSRLHEALETRPSLATHEVASGLAVTPILSFEARDGGFCRQLTIASSRAGSAAEALACRRDGAWRVEALSFGAVPASSVGAGPEGGEFRPAGRPSSAIDAAIDERIEGDPLDIASEAALIERGWSPR